VLNSSTSCQLELADAEEVAVTSAASIIAAQAPIASARRRKDLMAVLLLCLFVLLDGLNNPKLPAAGRSVRRESGERVVGPGGGH
jgi:hypothetical protein